MFSFFQKKKKKKKDPVHPTVAPPTSIQNTSPMCPLSPLVLHTGEPSTLPNQLEESQSVSPLSTLKDLSSCLPDTVPLAVPSDCIAALTGDPKEIISIRQLEEPNEHPYKWLDKMLNRICGDYAKWNGIMPSAVMRVPMGISWLCNTLLYFVEKGCATDEIFIT